MEDSNALYNLLEKEAAWDKEETLDRFMNSDELFMKFLNKFITSDHSYTKLRESLAKRDVVNAELHSHSLKGVSGNLGFRKLKEISSNMQELLKKGDMDGALRYEKALEEQYDALLAVIKKINI